MTSTQRQAYNQVANKMRQAFDLGQEAVELLEGAGLTQTPVWIDVTGITYHAHQAGLEVRALLEDLTPDQA